MYDISDKKADKTIFREFNNMPVCCNQMKIEYRASQPLLIKQAPAVLQVL